MRISLLILLLATAAPAQAVQPSPEEQAELRAERAEQRAVRRAEAREQRIERASDDDRPARRESEARPERREMRVERPQPREMRIERARPREMRVERPVPPADIQRPDAVRRVERAAGDSVREWRRRDGGRTGSPELVQQSDGAAPERMRDWRERQIERYARRGDADGRNPPVISRVPREGTQPPAPQARPAHQSANRHWNGGWRDDRRYNWRGWRERNRSRFHIGIYIDPFGWRYRPYSIGWRMWPHYYRSSSYWLNDPWSYRLPYAPAGYRWVRYYDDAVLVDTWDGRVVDVIHNFFW